MKQQPKQVTDAFEDQPTPQEETSFGDILNQFEQEQSEHAAHDAPGQTLQGTVVTVHDDNVVVDIGRKTEGIVPTERLRDDAGNITVKPGDTLTVPSPDAATNTTRSPLSKPNGRRTGVVCRRHLRKAGSSADA